MLSEFSQLFPFLPPALHTYLATLRPTAAICLPVPCWNRWGLQLSRMSQQSRTPPLHPPSNTGRKTTKDAETIYHFHQYFHQFAMFLQSRWEGTCSLAHQVKNVHFITTIVCFQFQQSSIGLQWHHLVTKANRLWFDVLAMGNLSQFSAPSLLFLCARVIQCNTMKTILHMIVTVVIERFSVDPFIVMQACKINSCALKFTRTEHAAVQKQEYKKDQMVEKYSPLFRCYFKINECLYKHHIPMCVPILMWCHSHYTTLWTMNACRCEGYSVMHWSPCCHGKLPEICATYKNNYR